MQTRTPAPVEPPHAHSRVTCSGSVTGTRIRSTASAGRLQAGRYSSSSCSWSSTVALIAADHRKICAAVPTGTVRPVSACNSAGVRVRDLNWFQLEDYLGRDGRIVLPIGSTEQHAYLSLETDNILAERVAAEAAE